VLQANEAASVEALVASVRRIEQLLTFSLDKLCAIPSPLSLRPYRTAAIRADWAQDFARARPGSGPLSQHRVRLLDAVGGSGVGREGRAEVSRDI
jgi:hypothetical protein